MEGKDAQESLHGVFGKVGGMWSGFCGTLCQAETVNYVESQMQMMGTDVKTFCSEFIQEVFSSSPAQTMTDPVDDFPLVQITEKVQCINVTDEIPSVEIPGKVIVEHITGKEEMRVSVDELDVIVPASFDNSCCQSHLTEDLGDDDLVLPGNLELSEWAGSSKEAVEQEALLLDGDETMLGESCIMICSSDPRPYQDQSTKQRTDMKKLLRKLGLRSAMVKYHDSRLEPSLDESCGNVCSTPPMEKLPSPLDTVVSNPQPHQCELLEQDWEII